MQRQRRAIVFVVVCVLMWTTATGAAAAPGTGRSGGAGCRSGSLLPARVAGPAARVAWTARLLGRTAVSRRPPAARRRASTARRRAPAKRRRAPAKRRRAPAKPTVGPSDAVRLLVLGTRTDRAGRCWLRVRLPTRPNDADGWIPAARVEVRSTPWRIVVSRGARTLALYHAGRRVRTARVVIGASATRTPGGLFSIVAVWPWRPRAFLGSYVIPLTAHSRVLQEFGGGDGQIAIHGRGGSSLRDPLGAARSHGCVRLANAQIEAIVRTVGAFGLTGIPVRVR